GVADLGACWNTNRHLNLDGGGAFGGVPGGALVILALCPAEWSRSDPMPPWLPRPPARSPSIVAAHRPRCRAAACLLSVVPSPAGEQGLPPCPPALRPVLAPAGHARCAASACRLCGPERGRGRW